MFKRGRRVAIPTKVGRSCHIIDGYDIVQRLFNAYLPSMRLQMQHVPPELRAMLLDSCFGMQTNFRLSYHTLAHRRVRDHVVAGVGSKASSEISSSLC